MISIVSLRLLLLVAVCSAVLLSAAGCGGNDDRTGLGVPSKAAPEATTYAGEWPAPNGDLANTRVASSKIDASNVSKLGVAWTAPIAVKGTFGGYASTPVIAGGVAYTQDLDSNVAAYDLSTGKQLWEHKYDSPTVGPNGVTIGYGKIYGATAEVAFALDAKSGEEVWRSKKLVRNANEGIDMAPAVYDHTVYVSTVPGNTKAFYKGNGQGVIWAIDADSGDPTWSFATVPEKMFQRPEQIAAKSSSARPGPLQNRTRKR
jgi:outer membrane protein assembly factor BamB